MKRGDLVTVASATLVSFGVDAKLWTFAGPDASLVLTAARAKLNGYIATSRRLGRDITLSGVYAALTVEGVQRVELAAPLADIVCDATQAANCVYIAVTHAGYAD